MSRIAHRLIAAWSLLAVMALVVTPRELLHTCEVRAADHQEHGEGAAIGTVCPVCDAAVPVAIGAEQRLEIVPVTVRALERGDAVRAAVAPRVLRSADRGPPTLV